LEVSVPTYQLEEIPTQREEGDERTIDQLKSDLALDLLIGEAEGVPLPTYVRPIVNLTVPVQTVMGLSDDPGVLSGGTVVPASLGRMIAQQPGSTWYRMFTDQADQAGQMVELSTRMERARAPSRVGRPVLAGPR
jgi:hypothetical protein